MVMSLSLSLPTVVWGQITSQEEIFPQFAVGGGTEYADGFRLVSGWETGVIVKNKTGVPAKVRVLFAGHRADQLRGLIKVQYPGENSLADITDIDPMTKVLFFPLEVAPFGSVQAIISWPKPEVEAGWLKVQVETPSQPRYPIVSVFLQYRYKVNSLVTGQATVNPGYYNGVNRDISFYARRYTGANQDRSETGLALVNLSFNRPSTCTFTRRNRDGGILDSFNEVIPGLGHFARFLGEMGPSLNLINYEGSMEVSCTATVIIVVLQMTGNGSNFNFSTINIGP